jgi:hypothetical protein
MAAKTDAADETTVETLRTTEARIEVNTNVVPKASETLANLLTITVSCYRGQQYWALLSTLSLSPIFRP